jgi:hypothetical protein
VGPTERIHGGNLAFVREFIKRSARNIKLHYVDWVWKKCDWVFLQVEDGYSTRRPLASGNKFAGKPKPPTPTGPKMQMD